MTGKADKAEPSLAPPVQSFNGAALREVALRVVVVDEPANLPEIEIIGSQALQRLFELPHRHLRVAPGVQTGVIRKTEERVRDRAPIPLSFAVVVFPGVVERGHAGVDRLVDDAHRLGVFVFALAWEVAAEAED